MTSGGPLPGSPGGAPRVCLLTETYHPIVGGSETQARLLSDGLLRRGAGVSIVTRRVDRRHPRRETVAGVTVHRLPPTGRRRSRKWAMVLAALPALLTLRRRYDLIFVSGFRILGAPAVVAARLCGVPCVLKADNLGELSGRYFAAGLAQLGLKTTSPAFRLALSWRNRLLRKAAAFVAISSAVRDELIEHGVSSQRIHDIPNSVDTARFHPVPSERREALRRRLGIPFEGPVVAYAGRLVSYKGLPLLLRVWEALRRAHPGAGLLLIGGGGLDVHNCEEQLREFVSRREMERCVHFTGNVDNVSELLQASDAFAMPTEREAFGIAVIEAMACGLPVVSTRVGGLRDIVVDGANALTVAPGDEGQLAAALARVIGDGGLRRRLGEAGRRTAEGRYSTEAVTGRYLELFQRMVSDRRRAGEPRADR